MPSILKICSDNIKTNEHVLKQKKTRLEWLDRRFLLRGLDCSELTLHSNKGSSSTSQQQTSEGIVNTCTSDFPFSFGGRQGNPEQVDFLEKNWERKIQMYKHFGVCFIPRQVKAPSKGIKSVLFPQKSHSKFCQIFPFPSMWETLFSILIPAQVNWQT